MEYSSGEDKFSKLLRNAISAEIARKIEFKRIEVSAENNEWTFFFACSEALANTEKNSIYNAIRAMLPAQIEIIINYELCDLIDIEKIIDECREINPILGRMLQNCPMEYKDGVLEIQAELLLDALNSMEAGDVIAGIIDELYERDVKVKISGESNIDYVPPKPVVIERKEEEKPKETENKPIRKRQQVTVIHGRRINNKFPVTDIIDLKEDEESVIVEGTVLKWEQKELAKIEKNLFTICVTDYTSSVIIKMFAPKEETEIAGLLKNAKSIVARGKCVYDDYSRCKTIMARDINSFVEEEKTDDAPEKRVELHLHTNLSALDSVVKIDELVDKAKQYGHDTIAVTDHGVVQAFPVLYDKCKKAGVKCIFGMEAYMVNDSGDVAGVNDERALEDVSYVVFDIESTGLNIKRDRLTEIGAVKITAGIITDSFSTFVNPQTSIPEKITELTGITDEMVKDAPDATRAIEEFNEFAKGCVLVAHNASFDMGIMREEAKRAGVKFKYSYLDTLAMSRYLFPEAGSHKLNVLAKRLKVQLVQHHRATSDAETTANIFLKMLGMFAGKGAQNLIQMTEMMGQTSLNSAETYHTIILAKNAQGLFNLYQMVTESHIKNFHRNPKVPKSLITQLRDGLIVGSACESGELYRSILDGASEEKIAEIAEFYDFLEIQPTGNNYFMVRDGQLQSIRDIEDINKRIIDLGDKLGKPVIATGDVHFLNARDEYFRRIIQHGQGYSDCDNQAPLYYRTTQEMLDEFAYLDEKKRYEIVVENTRKIAEQCEMLPPFPDDRLYTPDMPGAEDEIRNMAYECAHNMYGEVLPEIVEKRLNKELEAIIGNGFAVLYLVAHKVVKKSLSDGYLVGSRGSVGSSFVATMTGITEVNPLPPHYRCVKCKFSDFDTDTALYGCGFDLPNRKCPNCGSDLKKEGFDIPFEVFMGFKGNKAPDIDLNFSGKYQPVVHKYIEELFGEKNVFRAGTLSTLADKTALGYVRKYVEDKGLELPAAEMERLAIGVTDVKKSTGQHPGGMVVLPKQYDIHIFTPLQFPANDEKKGTITTHFAFSHLHDTMLKLDILGHDDPTVIRMLEDLTGLNAKTIPLDDQRVMSLFTSPKELGVTAEQIRSDTGTYGIPEFGTSFTRSMLVETQPKNFSDLVRISGLSHGTDVWTNNAQDLVNSGRAILSEVICTREDIMNYLIYKGMEPIDAFTIMESVRKGKGLKDDMVEKIEKVDVPDWFMDSCRKIKYMFPKAHAAAYVTMAYRIAYYKVYHPHEYYATYFTVRADDFDTKLVTGGVEEIIRNIDEMKNRDVKLNPREKGIVSMLEIAMEMNMRGIEFAPVSLMESDSSDFTITEDRKIRPPFCALAGLGANATQNIIEARKDGEFTSREDLIHRAHVSKGVMEILDSYGVLDGMPESAQMSFL